MKNKIYLPLIIFASLTVSSCSSGPTYFYNQASSTISSIAPSDTCALTDYVYEISFLEAKSLIDRGLSLVYYIGEDEAQCAACKSVKLPIANYCYKNKSLIYHTYIDENYIDLQSAYKEIFPERASLTFPSMFIINNKSLCDNVAYANMNDENKFASYMDAMAKTSPIINVKTKDYVVSMINNNEKIMCYFYNSSLEMANKAYQEGIYKYGCCSEIKTLFIDEDKFEEEDLFALRALLGVSISMGPTAHYFENQRRKERMEFTSDSFDACINLLKTIY